MKGRRRVTSWKWKSNGRWELNRQREGEASVWLGAETSLGFDRRRRSSKSDDGKSDDGKSDASKQQKQRRQAAKATTASKCDDEQANKTANRFGGDGKHKRRRAKAKATASKSKGDSEQKQKQRFGSDGEPNRRPNRRYADGL